jgi:tRNA C32,U32 (ribose-2'-O)-methylase TrmJ
MGFKNLELVKPGDFLGNEARQIACGSIDILKRARSI